jgi:hypothetical protein
MSTTRKTALADFFNSIGTKLKECFGPLIAQQADLPLFSPQIPDPKEVLAVFFVA